jgi:RNA polymerase sigma factor (sigma-70 family)
VTGRPDLTGVGAAAVFVGLYDTHARDLHRYLARRLSPELADDLVAETFLIAWERRSTYRPALGEVRGWLFGIATNLCRTHARKELHQLQILARSDAMGTPDPAGAVAARVDADRQVQRLAAAIASLREVERDVLLLVAWAGLAPREVAAALKINVATVRTRLHRARRMLRAHMEIDHD